MERVLRLDQAQEEEVRKEDSAKGKWAQKREAVPMPIELKAWRSSLRFLANIRDFPERWWSPGMSILLFLLVCLPAGSQAQKNDMSPHGGLSPHATLVSHASSS